MKYSVAELAETFEQLLRDLARVLTDHGVPWMMVGGLAVGGWTEPRATKDCDLAVALPTDVAKLEAALASVGLVVMRGDLSRAAEGGAVRLRLDLADRPALVVDLLCAGTPFEHEALRRRMPLEILGVPVQVASPDDLLIYKLIAGRPQDLADVDRLIRFGRVPADPDYVRRWAREWDVEADLDRALLQARRDG